MIAPNTADQNPLTWKPSTNEPTHQNSSPLITKMNRPSVRIVAGSVSRMRIGRISALMRPSTSAATIALVKLATWIPENTYGSASSATALIAALVLGLVNTIIRPVLVVLTLPVTLLTLGLFILVINGLLFWFVGSLDLGFTVDGFWTAVLGAVVYSVISWVLSALLPGRR